MILISPLKFIIDEITKSASSSAGVAAKEVANITADAVDEALKTANKGILMPFLEGLGIDPKMAFICCICCLFIIGGIGLLYLVV